MGKGTEANLDGRERRLLRMARENAWLDARGAGGQRLLKPYGLWCWKLKIPMVWLERVSPYSRYGRVKLDMLTTSHMLTASGLTSVEALAAASGARELARVTPHDAILEKIPMKRLERLARDVYRAATAAGNFRPNRAAAAGDEPRRGAKLVGLPRKAAS